MFYLFASVIILLQGLDLQTIGTIISYIVSVILGSVGYKYLKLWLSHSGKKEERKLKASENLVDNLEDRIQSLTKRVTELESRREESYKRELRLTKMLAKAEQKVKSLEGKVKMLERNQKVLNETVDKYYKKYGPLDEAS